MVEFTFNFLIAMKENPREGARPVLPINNFADGVDEGYIVIRRLWVRIPSWSGPRSSTG